MREDSNREASYQRSDVPPYKKTYLHNLRKKGCARPKINTQRFMNTFVNRLIFKLHLL